ncbi:MAG: hypothetical protein AAFN79_13650 [Pseudomonadota bacterium]
MKTGAGISGGAHVALIGLAIFAGDLFGADPVALPAPIAEVTLMTGTEFEAATSAAPEFNADLPPAPEAPNAGEERADIQVAEADAAPVTQEAPDDPDLPVQGEDVTPPEDQPVTANIAEVGDQPAAPLAPEDDIIVAQTEETDVIAPVAETPILQAPAPSPAAASPSIDTSSPEPPPQEVEPEPEPEVAETPPEPEPQPEPEVAEEPQPEEQEVVKLNDPSIPAPTLAPPPPTRPRELAEAAEAKRLARERATPAPEDQGATQQAETSQGGGTTQTVGRLSFRDRDSLRVGIKGFFNPPRGLQNEGQLAVKIQIQLSQDGRITGGPRRVAPSGALSRELRALETAGVRALKKSEAAGVFRKLPSDKYAQWRVINVTFTPREIQFL